MVSTLGAVLIALVVPLTAVAQGRASDGHDSGAGATVQACDGRAGAVAAFADPNLEAAVRRALGLGPEATLSCDRASTLTQLTAEEADIRDLRGIEALTGLTVLLLSGNPISDLGPVRGLDSLEVLLLYGGSVRDLSPLRNLERLRVLHIGANSITDIEPLRRLKRLRDLSITYNDVSDLGPIGDLTELEVLRVYGNPVSDIGVMRGLTKLTELHIHDLPMLSDITPLLENTGLGVGDRVILFRSDISCRDAAALAARGVSVGSGCLAGVPTRWWGLVAILGGMAAMVAITRRNRRLRHAGSSDERSSNDVA